MAKKKSTPGKIKLEFDKIDPALLGASVTKVAEFMTYLGSSELRSSAEDSRSIVRWQDDYIEQEIPKGTSVLDLGCGEGVLLDHLIRKKGVREQEIEIDSDSVFACIDRGVPVFQIDMEDGLSGFRDGSFDYVILEETLQTVQKPIKVLKEILRVGKHGIVSFPNFAYWRVRLDLAVRGRMPVTQYLPYRWYDSPNIHLFTIQDFLDWVEAAGVHIVKSYVFIEGQVRELKEAADNLYAEEALMVIERNGEGA